MRKLGRWPRLEVWQLDGYLALAVASAAFSATLCGLIAFLYAMGQSMSCVLINPSIGQEISQAFFGCILWQSTKHVA